MYLVAATTDAADGPQYMDSSNGSIPLSAYWPYFLSICWHFDLESFVNGWTKVKLPRHEQLLV